MALVSRASPVHSPYGHIPAHPFREICMSEMEMKTEAETEDFTEELSDEALDRDAAGSRIITSIYCKLAN
jgi:hypothetical protein